MTVPKTASADDEHCWCERASLAPPEVSVIMHERKNLTAWKNYLLVKFAASRLNARKPLDDRY